MEEYELGLIGLGTMGQNLLMNMGENGFSVAGYDKDEDKVAQLEAIAGSYPIRALNSAENLIAVLKKPRVVMLLVPAGAIVDAVIGEISPLLEEGDIIVDGGNSHFTDTDRRLKALEEKNIHFVGMGISGGAEGARKGPSMMPGGNETSWERIREIFIATAAKAGGEPCVDFMGQGSAGHYVKMVHNGIEYGLMELIAETYDFMKRGLGMDNAEIGSVFRDWNGGRLQSYLIEITGKIFNKRDELGKGELIDAILDESKQKGTGKWTSQDAMNLQVPVPTIDMAVAMRDMSGYKSERVKAAGLYGGTKRVSTNQAERQQYLRELEEALYFAFIITYAQGMAQLRKASAEYGYDLSPAAITGIWRGGCIIRAAMLEEFRSAFEQEASLENLLLDPDLAKKASGAQEAIRKILIRGIQSGIPLMALNSTLAYFDAYRSERLPANLTQAQRDFFGSHTYERLDRPGIFHTEWEENPGH